jgi:CheB methylesterase/CheR methyltransferase, SAM binding domain
MHSGEEVETREAGTARQPLVVGIGGSATARESIERFLSRLAPDADLAIVLVLRHREALDEAWLLEQLERLGNVKLTHVTDGAEIEGHTLYVCPANRVTTLQGGNFAVRAAEQAPGERATIDSFLVTLAEQRAERAIRVILAGTDGDGTLGMATLKDHSGLAIAELTEHTFVLLNVIKDAPFSKLDLVSCSNLLIYLNSELQNRVIPLLHFALLPGRFLFLGNSENVTRQPKLFAPVDRRARIFRKLETGTRLPSEFPIAATVGRSHPAMPAPRNFGLDIGLERRAQRVAERYAPAYVITDDNVQVLHFSGRTGRYIEPTAGVATLDLLSLVHRDLRLEMRTALSRARETNEAAHAQQISMGLNGHSMLVDITVEPIQEGAEGQRNLVVLFKDGGVSTVDDGHNNASGPIRSEHVERLEKELRATRERLQANIEELASTNEELKSSNEEYQSLNEGLQSANEELETSREELQSFNEELSKARATLTYDKAGLHCRIVVPLNRRIIHTPPLGRND